MKIGIMGGTFDPVHIGHLMLAEAAYKQYGLDIVWFLPNGNPPHKQTSETAEHAGENSLFHRIEMLRLAIKNFPYFCLSLQEAQEKSHSYTYQTMRRLHDTYPQDTFYFILGADSLFAIEQWKCFREIFPSCVILAAMRDGKGTTDMKRQSAYLKKVYGAEIGLLQTPFFDISSTEIRRRAAHGQTLHSMVPADVEAYIKRYRLYQTEDNNDGKSGTYTEKT